MNALLIKSTIAGLAAEQTSLKSSIRKKGKHLSHAVEAERNGSNEASVYQTQHIGQQASLMSVKDVNRMRIRALHVYYDFVRGKKFTDKGINRFLLARTVPPYVWNREDFQEWLKA